MGRVIAITGASAGIGRATALRHARGGAAVPGFSDRVVKRFGRTPVRREQR